MFLSLHIATISNTFPYIVVPFLHWSASY